MPYTWKPLLPSWELQVYGHRNTTRRSFSAPLLRTSSQLTELAINLPNLKSAISNLTDLIERLRKLEPSSNFGTPLVPYMSRIGSPHCYEHPPDLKDDPPIWLFKKQWQLSQPLGMRRAEFKTWIWKIAYGYRSWISVLWQYQGFLCILILAEGKHFQNVKI